MLLRHQLVYDYELYQISIHFPAFQHLFITLAHSTISIRKSPAPAGLFGAPNGVSLSRNPVCTQEQTGSRTYMSRKNSSKSETKDNRSLHFHVANFFKFMATNLSFTQFVT